MTVQPSAVGEVLDSYAGACTFLSRLFLQPVDESLVTALRDGSVLEDWPLAEDEDTVRGLKALRSRNDDTAGRPRGRPS